MTFCAERGGARTVRGYTVLRRSSTRIGTINKFANDGVLIFCQLKESGRDKLVFPLKLSQSLLSILDDSLILSTILIQKVITISQLTGVNFGNRAVVPFSSLSFSFSQMHQRFFPHPITNAVYRSRSARSRI